MKQVEVKIEDLVLEIGSLHMQIAFLQRQVTTLAQENAALKTPTSGGENASNSQ